MQDGAWEINLADLVYPIGSIYISVNSVNPQTLFGGAWEQLQDRFLLGAGKLSAGDIGGEETHTITISEMPSHAHGVATPGSGGGATKNVMSVNLSSTSQYNTTSIRTESSGDGRAHNNMPPYLVVYMWKRIG